MHLREILRAQRRALVAYSGGIDSAVLLAVACQELGDEVLAVTGRSSGAKLYNWSPNM